MLSSFPSSSIIDAHHFNFSSIHSVPIRCQFLPSSEYAPSDHIRIVGSMLARLLLLQLGVMYSTRTLAIPIPGLLSPTDLRGVACLGVRSSPISQTSQTAVLMARVVAQNGCRSSVNQRREYEEVFKRRGASPCVENSAVVVLGEADDGPDWPSTLHACPIGATGGFEVSDRLRNSLICMA